MFGLTPAELGLISVIGTCLFACWKGGPAERGGAILVAAIWIGLVVLHAAAPQISLELLLLGTDLLAGIGFLVLALRYASVWLGAGMLFEAISFFLHTAHFNEVEGSALSASYMMWINLVSTLVLIALIGGTVMAIRRREASLRRTLALDAGDVAIAPRA